ncbi:GNAT family N-acetyltransferase [Cellulosimicrobium cellulans]|uniref:GNAT family N-acetyltransferase n=1 Tax=Cellulosimicrobium cellulans TaxID=1710 RepID=UPI000848D656|nr:GNAT family N-acetyltransferase [Cellulosimicrobium cellulans]
MVIELRTPTVDELGAVVEALRRWQVEDAPLQLHPGDVGWFWRFGAGATASALRTWSRDGDLVAAGLLDGSSLLRLAVAPELREDDELARRLADDVVRVERGVLPAGEAFVEVPVGARVDDRLRDHGWVTDEPWALLRHDLVVPPPEPGLRVEVADADRAPVWADLMRASFAGSTFTAERWRAMAGGLPYADARSLLAHDAAGHAVGVVTVWSAGPGRPGLLEPMGVHPGFRGRGNGRAVTRAAVRTLRDLGASSALVCTPASDTAAVSTYVSAGFARLGERRDRRRPGPDLAGRG